jgi:hypothetical protein
VVLETENMAVYKTQQILREFMQIMLPILIYCHLLAFKQWVLSRHLASLATATEVALGNFGEGRKEAGNNFSGLTYKCAFWGLTFQSHNRHQSGNISSK